MFFSKITWAYFTYIYRWSKCLWNTISLTARRIKNCLRPYLFTCFHSKSKFLEWAICTAYGRLCSSIHPANFLLTSMFLKQCCPNFPNILSMKLTFHQKYLLEHNFTHISFLVIHFLWEGTWWTNLIMLIWY